MQGAQAAPDERAADPIPEECPHDGADLFGERERPARRALPAAVLPEHGLAGRNGPRRHQQHLRCGEALPVAFV